MSWFRQSLARKLLFIIFLVAIVPYAVILFYTTFYANKTLTKNIITTKQAQLHQIKLDLYEHFNTIKRELYFLSTIENMDDIVTHDLDQRILSLLERYRKTFSFEATLLVVDTQGNTIASTDISQINTLYQKSDFFLHKKEIQNIYSDDKSLYFVTPIEAHFNSKRLGYLVMEYPLENLDRFNINISNMRTSFINTKNSMRIGKFLETNKANTLILDEILSPVLASWKIELRLDKNSIFEFLAQLNSALILLLFFGIIVIGLLSYWVSRRIVSPLLLLQEHTKSIITSQDYSTKISINSKDEIGQLADTFNIFSLEIQKAFLALQKESNFRMQRLTQLINLFNQLLDNNLEEECLDSALIQINTIAPEYKIHFLKNVQTQSLLHLYIYNFEYQKREYYGSLKLSKTLNGDEQLFFEAIASMIASRIEQIRAYQRLECDTQAKNSFVSHLSHDLRTPLHAIMSQTQYLIAYENLSDTQLEKVGTIESSASNLLQMINDLLELAKVESGDYSLTCKSINTQEFNETIEYIITMLEPLAQADGNTITFIKPNQDIELMIDKKLLQHILINLLSNAIKFTKNGKIHVEIIFDKELIYLHVRDNGIGISVENINRVMNIFTQIKSHDNHVGTGLGLALAQKYSHLIGATLHLKSDGINKGATAILCFNTITNTSNC